MKDNAVFITGSITIPPFFDSEGTQIIRFGTGLEFKRPDQELPASDHGSAVFLPCLFGTTLQGPVLLATGTVPSNVPFPTEDALRD